MSVSTLHSLLFIKEIPFLVCLLPPWLPLLWSTWRRDFLFKILCPWLLRHMVLFQLLLYRLPHGSLNSAVLYFNDWPTSRPTILFVLYILFYTWGITQICRPWTTSLHCTFVLLNVCWLPPSPTPPVSMPDTSCLWIHVKWLYKFALLFPSLV